MKLFVFLLIITALLQTTFLQVNMVLVLLVCRSLLREERANYFSAFFIGILLGILESRNVGFYALFFVILVKVLHLIKSTPISAYFLTVIPATLVLSFGLSYLKYFIFNQSVNNYLPLIDAFLSLPVYLLLKIWEERFVVNRGIKLKIRN